MKTERELLEDILVAQVLALSKLHHAERRAKGTDRSGGDYTDEAFQEIRASRSNILRRLLSEL